MEAPIVNRYLRLKKQILEPSDSGLTFEGLIDALLVLYEECGHDKVKSKNEVVAGFLAKFQSSVHNYNKLRVNVGDFQVKRVIGRGNFGEVKLVKEKCSGAVYALKVLKKTGDLVFFSEERDIMARNSSPWLTKLDYAFQDGSYLYLAMEYHCGGDLLGLMERMDNNLDEASVRFYTAEVCLGIHDLHKMGFVHRDIKPENILIDRTGHVKLADFGNAAVLSTSGTVSKVMPCGTPDYIAPEVLQCLQGGHCKSESHGAECDYWSVGILAYEMLYGSTPFTDMEGSVINTYSNIMMHQNKVNFPWEREASQDFKDLVEGLLKPADKRLGHSKLLRHPFFSSLDWSNMLNATPPYVPDVKDDEDDSHFDIIDDVPSGPDIASLKGKKEFKNLPFVGFTYTADKDSVNKLDKNLDKGMENELKKKIAELEKLKLKNFQLEQQALNHTRVAESSVREFEQIERLTTQLNIAEQDNGELKATISHMERIMEIERTDRLNTEQKTLELLADVKKKWARAEEERMEVVKTELAEEKERSANFENKYRECQSDLRKTQAELEATVQVKTQLKNKLKDYKQRLENVAAMEDRRSQSLHEVWERLERGRKAHNKIANLEAEKAELNNSLNMARSQLDESRCLDEKVDALQMIIDQRDQILNEKESELKIKSAEVDSFTEKQKKLKTLIQNLESDLKEKAKECEKLQADLEVAKNETRVESDSQLTVQAQLKNEIKDILTENAELKSKMKSKDDKVKSLEEKVANADKEKISLLSKLEIAKLNLKKELEDQEEMYKEKMKGLESVFESLQSRIDELQKKKKSDEDKETKKELNALETRNEQLEKEKLIILKEKNEISSDLDKFKKDLSKLKKEKETLDEELKTLKSKHDETIIIDNEESKKLKTENETLANELKEVKLDLRLEKREVEKKSSLLTYVREKEAKNREKIQEIEKEKSELETEVKNLKISVEGKDSQLEEVKTKEEKFNKQIEEIRKLKDEKCESSIEIRKLKTDAAVVEAKIEAFKKKIESLEKENEKCKSLEINNQALMELSKELDSQVVDFESIKEKLETKIQKIEEEKRDLVAKLDKEKEETRKAKIAVNEEKSNKILQESKIKDFKQRLNDSEKELEEAKKTHEKHIGEYKDLCKKLSDTLEDLTKDNANKDQFGKLNERAKTVLEVENKQLKEELTDKITQLHSHKESNFKLSQGIEEAIEKIKVKNQEIDDLKIKMESESRLSKEKNLRLEATQSQQTKLIDFLQTKVNNFEGRKKTFADKIFGSANKENRGNMAQGVPVAYADLEGMLEREKTKTKKLVGQLDKARAEVVALKTVATSDLTSVPRTVLQQLDSGSATTSHNIPHRLVTITNKKSVKCVVCQDTVSILTAALSCRDCGIIVHSSCAPALPNTCGLSSALASVTTTASTPISNRPLPPAPSSTSDNKEILKEGKLQYLVSGQWTEVFLVLRSSGVLDIFTGTSSDTKLDQLGLTLAHCAVSLQSNVSYSEVYHVSTTDRPYTFKLTVHTIGKLEKAMYFMCGNFSSKVDWVNKLEEVIKSSPANLAPVKTSSSVTRAVVCSLPPPEEVLAAVRIKDTLVLGTTQGLALVRDNVVVPVPGLVTPVHSLQQVSSLQLLVLATGQELVTADSRSILSGSSPVDPQPIPDITRCHIFSCTENNQGKVYLCAANEHLVTIMEWSHKRGHFVLRNKFSTDQPTKSIHFTDHSVLVGTSKFYEIDLKNFSAEEFLDLSHPGIQKSVASLEFKESTPHGVMNIPNDDTAEEKEYALAFTRIILFVDSFGQETRPPLMFEKLPVEHRMLGHCILVTTFCDRIQFINLQDGSKPGLAKLLPASSPHLVTCQDTDVKDDLLYSCQDTASNNLMVVSVEDLELSV